MKLIDITKGADKANVIPLLKKHRNKPEVDVEKALKAIDPLRHDVMDETIRKKKEVSTDTGTKFEEVARIALAFQKLIINHAVSFCFGNEVNQDCIINNDTDRQAFEAYKNVLKDNKSKSLNRKIARALFTFSEVAEYWYTVETEKGEGIGVDKNKKIRVSLLTPDKNKLYPYFDETGKMIAFSREYQVIENDEKVSYFETWTDEDYTLMDLEGNIKDNGYKVHGLGKIPIVFLSQDDRETADIDKLVDRLETTLSNFADNIDYHSAPITVVNGPIRSFLKKGEQGGILEVDTEVKPYYLEWSQAPEATRTEVETLTSLIYTLTQTPDISFDNMKNIGSVAEMTLRLMFMDAHLKVQDKCEIFDDSLQRRASIIKNYLCTLLDGEIATAAKKMAISQEIVPYMYGDTASEINNLLSANGNKPLISHKQSVIKAALTPDPAADYEQILTEGNEDSYTDITEPTI